MAQITITQANNDPAGGNASLSGVTSGRVLVYCVMAGRFFGATPDVTSVSGGTGTTWTRRVNVGRAESGVFIFVGTGNTAATVTMSCTGSFDEIISTLFELDVNASDFDVGASSSGASGTALNSGTTATLDSADDLAIGAGHVDANFISFTPGGGFTEQYDNTTGGYSATTSYLQVTGTTGLAASYTSSASSGWTCGIVTIKIAGGGAATSMPPMYQPSRATRANLRR